MKAFTIALTGVRRLLRDRSNIFFVFILPMLLILLLGAAFGGGFEARVGILSVNAGALGEDLADHIEMVDSVTTSAWDERAELVRAVERGRLEAAVIIPERYDEDLRAGRDVTVEFIARPDPSTQAMRNTIESLAVEQGSLLRAAALASEFTDASYSQALETADRLAEEERSLTVEAVFVGDMNPFASLGMFELGAYSQLLLFVFLTSMTGSTALIESRRLGVSTRMLSTPTPVRMILLGEGLGRLGVALVQGVFIIVGSSLFFGVEWGDPLGAAAIFFLFALGASGTAMLMGSVFRNAEQAGGVGVVVGIGLGALGGAMVPLAVMEIFSPTLYRVAHLTPHAWAIEGFQTLIMRRGTIADITLELTVLLAFAVAMYTLGAWRLRVSLTRP
jgi:ABC-2 type transport system permease protein